MSNRNDGGAAFPDSAHDADGELTYRRVGMTLRDYFAGEALAGLCTADCWRDLDGHGGFVSGLCYQMADAMLEERAK